jgi:hypothetical protein
LLHAVFRQPSFTLQAVTSCGQCGAQTLDLKSGGGAMGRTGV